MKIFLLTIAILFSAMSISAQEECELPLSQSPTLQFLRLGMSPPEATKALKTRVKVKANGERVFFKNYIKRRAKGNLTGIRAIFLRFFDARLYQIEIFYEADYLWPDLTALLADFSARNNFPPELWQTDYGYAKANCGGFVLDADYILNPHIQITDPATAEQVEKVRAAKTKKNTD